MKVTTLYSILIFLASLIILILFSLPRSTAQLIACDVGQGDAILITKGSTQILVDGGPRGSTILSCLARHIPFWDRQLELVVFTNTDFDHLGGLSSVLTRYQVSELVTGDGVGASDAVSQFVDTLRATNLHVTQVGQGDTIKVDSLTFRVLWPLRPNQTVLAALDPDQDESFRNKVLGVNIVQNINERSVVLLLKENGYQAILTGDIGTPTEESLLASHLLGDIDLLKVGHHGSKYSSSKDFLSIIQPEVAIISVGKNTYGHPTSETLSRLTSVGATIRRTDQEGDIVINLTKHP